MAKLKEATKHQHDQLEGGVDIMKSCLDRRDYADLIERFYSFYRGIEPMIASKLAGTGIDIDRRLKTSLLAKDLQILDSSDDKAERLPAWDRFPAITNRGQALGAMYVLEGATLGGQVISRQLQNAFGITSENGGAFFNSYGDQVGPMWKEFKEFANALATDNGNDDEIVIAAQGTFSSFAECFAEPRAA